MKRILDQFFSGGYESFLIEGNPETVLEALKEDPRLASYTLRANLFTQLGMPNIEPLIGEMSLREETLDRIIYLGAHDITREAEHALLKFLEEPKARTKVLLVSERALTFLPTIHSRMTFLGAPSEKKTTTVVADFLKQGSAKRLAYVKELLDEEEEGNTGRIRAEEEIKAMIDYFRTQAHTLPSPDAHKALTELAKALSVLGERGAPVKMIYEHLALVLPLA